MAKRTANVNKATVVGASAAPPSAAIVTWAALEMHRRTGIPIEVCAAIIGTVASPVFGFITRWAAKLDPRN